MEKLLQWRLAFMLQRTFLLRARGNWVPLPSILALGIAQFGARIFELRRGIALLDCVCPKWMTYSAEGKMLPPFLLAWSPQCQGHVFLAGRQRHPPDGFAKLTDHAELLG